MKVRDEIEKYASEKEKPILLWLFERNHWESQWMVVANCTFEKYGRLSYESRRIWHPTAAGMREYEAARANVYFSVTCDGVVIDAVGSSRLTREGALAFARTLRFFPGRKYGLRKTMEIDEDLPCL